MDFKIYLLIEELDQLVESLDYSINPSTGKTWRHREKYNQLKTIVDHQKSAGVNENDLWVTFSDVQRLGIKPSASDGDTPMGLYAYPIKYVMNQIQENPRNHGVEVPLGGNRSWMLIFKINREKLLTIKKQNDKDLSELKSLVDKMPDSFDHLSLIYKKINKSISIYSKNYKLSSFLKNKANQIIKNLNKASGKELKTKINEEINNIFSFNFDFEYFLKNIEYRTHPFGLSYRRYLYEQVDMANKTATLYDFAWKDILSCNPDHVGTFPAKQTHTFDEVLSYKFDEEGYCRINLNNKNGELLLISFEDFEYYKQQLAFAKYKDTPEGDGIKSFLKKLFDQLEPFYEQYKIKSEQLKNDVNFPYKEALIAECDKIGIDWMTVIKKMGHMSYSDDAKFIYRFTRKLAELKQKQTEKPYHVEWMKILRNIGVAGISDEFGTGTIYSSEPTQGAFFDPKHFKLIATIINNRRNLRSPKNNPAKHERNVPSNRSPENWDPNLSAHARTFSVLQAKFYRLYLEIASNLYFSKPTSPAIVDVYQYVQSAKDSLRSFTVLLKYYLKEKMKLKDDLPSKALGVNVDLQIKRIIDLILNSEKIVSEPNFVKKVVDDVSSLAHQMDEKKSDMINKFNSLVKIHKQVMNSLRMLFNIPADASNTVGIDLIPATSVKKLKPRFKAPYLH